MGAEFKVVRIDPEGSGMDYQGHLGATVTDAKRCCKNCTIIFGTCGSNTDFGPFTVGELKPLNDEATRVLGEIRAFVAERFGAEEMQEFFGDEPVSGATP